MSVRGSLVPLAPLPLTAVRVGVGALVEGKAGEIKRSARGRFFWLCLSLFGGAGQPGQRQE